MTIDEAIKQLELFCKTFENEEIKKYTLSKYGNIDSVEKDYEATKIILNEIEELKEKNKELIEELKFCYVMLKQSEYPENLYIYHLKKLLQEENNETN